MKAGGSLPRGRRRRDEVPPVPMPEGLNAVEREARGVLQGLVERAGGRFSSTVPIEVDQLEVFEQLFNGWAQEHSEPTDYGICFKGRPGLWHALDELYPLQDPNRWDRLREAVIAALEDVNWVRRSRPRGSVFDIHVR
jgi:hypothetical protein